MLINLRIDVEINEFCLRKLIVSYKWTTSRVTTKFQERVHVSEGTSRRCLINTQLGKCLQLESFIIVIEYDVLIFQSLVIIIIKVVNIIIELLTSATNNGTHPFILY